MVLRNWICSSIFCFFAVWGFVVECGCIWGVIVGGLLLFLSIFVWLHDKEQRDAIDSRK